MSSTDTDSTTTGTIVLERGHWHSLRSRLYTGPGLPTYHTFLNQLQDLEPGSLTAGSYCPICRTPFSESQATPGNAGSEHRHVLALEALPFHVEDSSALFDRPVRLPCASQHIVGKACIMKWATEGGGTTCPLDREALFTIGPEDSFRVTDDEDRFNNGLRDIEKMPIRQLLQRFRTAAETDIVTVNARSMTKRLTTLLFRIIFETHGIPEAATLRWKWPRIRRPLYGYNEATAFRAVVKHFLKTEPLPESGRYPRHIITLLNLALPHVFALLYRLARSFQAHRTPLNTLACTLRYHLAAFFVDFSHLVTDGKVLESIAFKTVDVWTTQELLASQLRTATNQSNEWDDIVGPRDPQIERVGPVRPYFGLGGRAGIGYAVVGREAYEVPLTLGAAAAEFIAYDGGGGYEDWYVLPGERDSPRSHRAGSSRRSASSQRVSAGQSRSSSRNPSIHSNDSSTSLDSGHSITPARSLSLRSSSSRDSRLGWGISPRPSVSVRPWSPLSDESDEGACFSC